MLGNICVGKSNLFYTCSAFFFLDCCLVYDENRILLGKCYRFSWPLRKHIISFLSLYTFIISFIRVPRRFFYTNILQRTSQNLIRFLHSISVFRCQNTRRPFWRDSLWLEIMFFFVPWWHIFAFVLPANSLSGVLPSFHFCSHSFQSFCSPSFF